MYKVLIFGAGKNSQQLMNCLQLESIEILAFLDNNKEKQGKIFQGKPILSPNQIKLLQYDYIIIGSIFYQIIHQQLLEIGVDKNKIINIYQFNHDNYNKWKNILNISEILYLELNQKLLKIDYYLENFEYELFSKLQKNLLTLPHIESVDKAIYEIIINEKSLSRFGDGEFDIIFGNKLGFQEFNLHLQKRLKEILKSNLDNLIIGLPDAYGDFYGREQQFIDSFRKHFSYGKRQMEYELIDMNKTYYDSFITRPYMAYLNKKNAKERFELVKKIWNKRDILIIEGFQTRSGLGNDLFCNTLSCQRILCPSINAFRKYDEIFDAAKKYGKEKLILVALGPTATVLTFDLAKAGYQAVDIGHIDIEYEWYLAHSLEKKVIKYKYTHEVAGGNHVEEYEDSNYRNQIIYEIIE